MGFLVKTDIWSLTLCLNLLRIFGFSVPGKFTGRRKLALRAYWTFWYIFLNGIYVIVQAGDLVQIWGDLPLMVSTSFLLFTNIAFGTKVINVIWKRDAIQTIVDDGNDELVAECRAEGIKIVKSCNRETSQQFYLYAFLSAMTCLGWAAGAEKNSLPLRAWYPYDTSKSPAYEMTFAHQSFALLCSACLNVCLDTLVTSLIAVCRCRLRLLAFSLRRIGNDKFLNNKLIIDPEQEKTMTTDLNRSVERHQAVLRAANEIQTCFNEPIFVQFTVSMIIICVTAYQLAVELHTSSKNIVKIVGMTSYFFCMILQVFLYCFQGNQLSVESSELSRSAYECPWYLCSPRFRRALLYLMMRSDREAKLTAAGLTTLSLACFTAIIKASYTFFTVLQQVEDRPK